MVKLSNTVPRKLIRLPITELCIDRVTLLIVTYPINNNALMSLFITRQTLNLSSSIVVIGHHFTIRISHRLHPVPAIIRYAKLYTFVTNYRSVLSINEKYHTKAIQYQLHTLEEMIYKHFVIFETGCFFIIIIGKELYIILQYK